MFNPYVMNITYLVDVVDYLTITNMIMGLTVRKDLMKKKKLIHIYVSSTWKYLTIHKGEKLKYGNTLLQQSSGKSMI